jgi:hypothetical protein
MLSVAQIKLVAIEQPWNPRSYWERKFHTDVSGQPIVSIIKAQATQRTSWLPLGRNLRSRIQPSDLWVAVVAYLIFTWSDWRSSRDLSVWIGDVQTGQLRTLNVGIYGLDDWLTVHRNITLVNFQFDAQNSYLFIYNTFIKILYMFRALPCSSSGGVRRNCIYAASGIVTVCR